ncbi:MAG: UDP-N-acetylglucosamine 1-carboxyvinyltransferase [Candidatus Nomurabacteria bacterium]|jgi:UDP-N-acetylglucosamine 1-carboxyvinyltransferase|nr:UDP-N-acetylglucosamine 1-carboxyvinyltransferase [Candidatus Nomurabacteria bacterium]
MDTEDYKVEIGDLIQEIRQDRGLTQAELAKKLGTSQSAINRIEKGKQNISLDMIAKLSDVLDSTILSVNQAGTVSFKINGGRELHGAINVNTSKNAAVGLLCASLLNRGKTTLRRVAKIEEVYRIIEVLESIGVKVRWIGDDEKDLEISTPKRLQLSKLDTEAALRTRSVIMLMGPLIHLARNFNLPHAGGCHLGKRTVEPHLQGLEQFGLSLNSHCGDYYGCRVKPIEPGEVNVVLSERGDTVTENVLMAAALHDGVTTIRGASSNYMVQDVCFYLEKLGVKVEGVGTTTLKVHGKPEIDEVVEYWPSEDPIEAMSFIAAGIVTHSEITIKRAPIEFLEIELETLRSMGLKFELSSEYMAHNKHTRLVDLTIKKSDLVEPKDKVAPMPFPGLNIDNLPFFAVVAASANGQTLLHDWVFENRAIYLTELSKLNVSVQLLDVHRAIIEGPTNWRPAEIIAPPALRPAIVIMLGMLAAPGESILRNVYSINRGYEDLANRLNSLGAHIETLTGI